MLFQATRGVLVGGVALALAFAGRELSSRGPIREPGPPMRDPGHFPFWLARRPPPPPPMFHAAGFALSDEKQDVAGETQGKGLNSFQIGLGRRRGGRREEPGGFEPERGERLGGRTLVAGKFYHLVDIKLDRGERDDAEPDDELDGGPWGRHHLKFRSMTATLVERERRQDDPMGPDPFEEDPSTTGKKVGQVKIVLKPLQGQLCAFGKVTVGSRTYSIQSTVMMPPRHHRRPR